MARAAGGRFLLRIEDIDAARCRPEYEQAIYEDLAWLGIAWEEPVRRQSAHFDDYRAALARLERWAPLSELREPRRDRAAGGRAGEPASLAARSRRRAALSRRRALALAPPNAGGACEAGEPYALRLDMAAAMARTGPLTWTETGAGPEGETGSVAAAPQLLGRRGAGAQGDADELPPLGRHRRCAAKASPTSCAGRTCSGRPASTACSRRCSTCRHPDTITIA